MHTGHLDRAKDRYDKACARRGKSKTENTTWAVRLPMRAAQVPKNLLSKILAAVVLHDQLTIPFQKQLCFFCQMDIPGRDIHEISTFNAGEQLRQAVEASGNAKWKVHLSAAISAADARAIDVKYHLVCWVNHVQRAPKKEMADNSGKDTSIGIVASDVEFISLVRGLLNQGSVLSMADLRSTYTAILQTNDIQSTSADRNMKAKVISHIENLQFMKSKRRNESKRVFCTAVAIEDVFTHDSETQVRKLFDSASILRKSINDQTKHPWEFEGALSTKDAESMYKLFCTLSSDGYCKDQLRLFRLKYVQPRYIKMYLRSVKTLCMHSNQEDKLRTYQSIRIHHFGIM